MSDYPEDLKYTAEHEWVRSGNGSTVRIGITEYAADQLGDIVFASLPSVGESVEAGTPAASWSRPRASPTSTARCPASSPRSTPCWRATRRR